MALFRTAKATQNRPKVTVAEGIVADLADRASRLSPSDRAALLRIVASLRPAVGDASLDGLQDLGPLVVSCVRRLILPLSLHWDRTIAELRAAFAAHPVFQDAARDAVAVLTTPTDRAAP